MSSDKIQITGLREFQAALRKMDADLPKQLRVAQNEAMGVVIDYASAHMPSVSGAARGSLKGRSTQREAKIGLGGRKAPYAPWLDFGGQGRIKGRPVARPFIKEGRYVYRGLRVKRDDITKILTDGLTALATSAGLEVS